MKAEISMKGYPDDTEGFCLIPLALSPFSHPVCINVVLKPCIVWLHYY